MRDENTTTLTRRSGDELEGGRTPELPGASRNELTISWALPHPASQYPLARTPVESHVAFVTLLQERDRVRRQRRLELHAETRSRLRAALASLIPGHKVIVFGSLTQPGRFNDRSDINLALESEPSGITVWRLASELMELMDRPVDVVLLEQCRFREKILREGEVWIA